MRKTLLLFLMLFISLFFLACNGEGEAVHSDNTESESNATTIKTFEEGLQDDESCGLDVYQNLDTTLGPISKT